MIDDLDRFDIILVLSPPLYEHLNLIVKTSYDCTYKLMNTRTGDAVKNLDTSCSWKQFSVITLPQYISLHYLNDESPALRRPDAGLVRN